MCVRFIQGDVAASAATDACVPSAPTPHDAHAAPDNQRQMKERREWVLKQNNGEWSKDSSRSLEI